MKKNKLVKVPASKKAVKKINKAAPATAAGQALGYSLQYTRLTVMLLEAEQGSFCSLEVLDDVTAKNPDGTDHLVQSKSALKTNPVANKAISLWKTLYNWAELVQKGLVQPENTVFEVYVSRKVDGKIIKSFNAAQNLEQARVAYDDARCELWGVAPDYPLKKKISPELAKYTDHFFSSENNGTVLKIIANLKLKCGSGSPQKDLEKLLGKHPILETVLDDVKDKLLGWVKSQVDTRLEKGLPAIISKDEFHKEYTSYVRWADRETILKSFTPKPTEEQKLAHISSVFVKQLELIDLDFDDTLDAISDFLRAASDRTFWSQSGHVHKDFFETLNEGLQRTWKNICKQKLIEHSGNQPKAQGAAIYAACMLHKTSVQGMDPPGHFIPGCFHLLADELEVGWHPNYRIEIDTQKKLLTA